MLIYTTKQKHQYYLQDFVTAILITRANKTIKPIVWYKTFFLAQESSNNWFTNMNTLIEKKDPSRLLTFRVSALKVILVSMSTVPGPSDC